MFHVRIVVLLGALAATRCRPTAGLSSPATTTTTKTIASVLGDVRATRVLPDGGRPVVTLGEALVEADCDDGNARKTAETTQRRKETVLAVFGTYAADFNAIEYVQRLRHYGPKLAELGCARQALVLNAEPEACETLRGLLDLPSHIELYSDPSGAAGRAFGVERGWLADEESVSLFGLVALPASPYLKLFGMLWGLGAWATLPAVIGGYLGNPFRAQPWIRDAFAQNNANARWPEATEDAFAAIPVVGAWKRRPLELATLRLQNMLGVSIRYWDDLRPTNDHLDMLTQLGGLCVFDRVTGDVLYEWRDPGICAVCNFEDALDTLEKSTLVNKPN